MTTISSAARRLLAAVVAALVVCAPALRAQERALLDLLVIAPHPDDEIIGCAGVMLQALAERKHVGVVILTNGDAHVALTAVVAKKDKEQLVPEDFMRAGALRQGHSIAATVRIGLPREELVFLGYPDSGLEKIFTLSGSAEFEQAFTQKRETYGLAAPDYRTAKHGKPAPYLKASVVNDLAEIIRERRPMEIYVTDPADKHPDHRTASSFVREALLASKHHAGLFTYIVHGDPPPEPSDRRVVLTTEQQKIKRAAIEDHQKGTSPIHDQLAVTYAKPEEVFWRAKIPAAK